MENLNMKIHSSYINTVHTRMSMLENFMKCFRRSLPHITPLHIERLYTIPWMRNIACTKTLLFFRCIQKELKYEIEHCFFWDPMCVHALCWSEKFFLLDFVNHPNEMKISIHSYVFAVLLADMEYNVATWIKCENEINLLWLLLYVYHLLSILFQLDCTLIEKRWSKWKMSSWYS